METLEQYRKVVRELIEKHAQLRPALGGIEYELNFNEAIDHYALLANGWNGPYRIEGHIIHVDIRNGKIWIQHDGTEEGIAEQLVAAGIPRDKIVLAYKSERMRRQTEFAVS
jgi:hypothetical protein